MARITFTLEDGTELETELDADVVTVGRHPENSVVLPGASVSGHHATVTRQGDAYFVRDLGTTNGTKLNGVQVEEAKLEDGDRIVFGHIPAVFQLNEPVVEIDAVEPPPPTAAVISALNPARPGVRPGARPGARPGTRPTRRGSAAYSDSSGCAGFIAILTVFLVAFAGGMILAHALKYHRFLLPDLVNCDPVANLLGKSSESAPKDGDKPAK